MDMNECACSGKSLTRLLRPAIMALLAKGNAHGYELAQALAALKMFADQQPDPTGIYRTLKQMEDEGLLRSQWDLADSGPAKRVFALTADGKACLGQWVCTIRHYRDAVNQLLGLLEKVC